ncbi:hypothetical protein [Arabiibacter massiliensis]|uniref:hypothetical protein n=1 Tax=Arabiibacter massiliensis TaxID=1870985 RepID=UPI0009B9E15D|nr:hypothetical protein [Arabiibacter massiliensis]
MNGEPRPRALLRRIRAAVTPDRLLATLCLVAALAMAAPWVRVSVADLIDRDVSYSVPDVLATGQVLVDRAQSLADLVEKARAVADRAAQIVERAQDAAERVSDVLDERG